MTLIFVFSWENCNLLVALVFFLFDFHVNIYIF